jgi:hypothetical protein
MAHTPLLYPYNGTLTKYMQDIQADLGFVAPSDMKAQIKIRMNKIASRDPPTLSNSGHPADEATRTGSNP